MAIYDVPASIASVSVSVSVCGGEEWNVARGVASCGLRESASFQLNSDVQPSRRGA